MEADSLYADWVVIPASPGWIGLDVDERGWHYVGNVLAWHVNPKSEGPDLWGLTEYGLADGVVSPDGAVARTGFQRWDTIAEFLSDDQVRVEDHLRTLLEARVGK